MKPTEKELEIALQYGVTSPQVSRNLNWQKETAFFYWQDKDRFEIGCIFSLRNNHSLSEKYSNPRYKAISAPTLYELAKATAELLDVPITHVWSLYAEKGVQTADDAAKVYLDSLFLF